MERHALQMWATPPDGGAADFSFDRRLVGVSAGAYVPPTPAIWPVLAAIEALARADASLVATPREHLHFTFLALSLVKFSSAADIPADPGEVLPHVPQRPLNLERLRIVPLNGALVLAGVPTPELVAAREAFARAALASSWRPLLVERYSGYPIPPDIWHTTLLRSRSATLPAAAQALFHDWRGVDLGAVELPPPKLFTVNFDWSCASEFPS